MTPYLLQIVPYPILQLQIYHEIKFKIFFLWFRQSAQKTKKIRTKLFALQSSIPFYIENWKLKLKRILHFSAFPSYCVNVIWSQSSSSSEQFSKLLPSSFSSSSLKEQISSRHSQTLPIWSSLPHLLQK